MKNVFYLVPFYLLFVSCSVPEPPPPPPPITIAEVEERLQAITALEYDYERYDYISDMLDSLKLLNQFPIIEDSTVLFVHFGIVKNVSWIGDFNDWGADESVDTQGTRMDKSSIWTWKTTFPKDARLDYKIHIDDELAILDPFNRNKQKSETSENSVLTMPDWESDPITQPRREIDRGTMSEPLIIESSSLQEAFRYFVYTPFGYEKMENLPVVYVLNGQAYMNSQLGNMGVVLDNIISDGLIEPVVAVFVDSRDPNDKNYNRKGQLLSANDPFKDFINTELIPMIDSNYKTNASATGRAILGSSLGGLTATHIAFSEPAMFSFSASQSPAYWYKPEIYDIVGNSSISGLNVFLSAGSFYDGNTETEKVRALMETNGHRVHFTKTNQGASWGAWAPQIDDILIQFFGK